MKNIKEILEWVEQLTKETLVNINRIELDENNFWYIDEDTGDILNRSNAFFSISGIKGKVDGQYVEQPILLQDEIGYLGILCIERDGELYYLMQAKIEPGNVNCIQISPTIQATKSNFTQKHGGAKPSYLDFFINADKHVILADQIQSEQSSRFYKKRNRNMIVLIQEEIIVEKRFCWMKLEQIKELMKYRNLVNMDTRTVLSCLPYIDKTRNLYKACSSARKSIECVNYVKEITEIYHDINNYKMFNEDYLEIVNLNRLENWVLSKNGVKCIHDYPFEIIFCDIEIEGREVRKWSQPLFKSNGIALFGLFYTIIDGEIKFIVKVRPEIGCFDRVEIGPTIQKEAGSRETDNFIEALFSEKLNKKEGVVFDNILSEEGGRFYHEENRNVIIQVEMREITKLPKGFHLVSYGALNHLNLINNCLNIQLRNLISVLEV